MLEFTTVNEWPEISVTLLLYLNFITKKTGIENWRGNSLKEIYWRS